MAPSRPLERSGWRESLFPGGESLSYAQPWGRIWQGGWWVERSQGRRWAPLSCYADEEEGMDGGHSSQGGEEEDKRRQQDEELGMKAGAPHKTDRMRRRGTGEGEGRRSKVVRGKRLRKWKRKKGREKVRRMETGWEGRLCWEDWIRGGRKKTGREL